MSADLTPERIDRLIERWVSLGEDINKLQSMRREVRDKLGLGRVEGNERAAVIYRSGLTYKLDPSLLRRYVPKDTLERCRVRVKKSQQMRLVKHSKYHKGKAKK